jgi:glycosyltransferase involved in cell wall biosynthesis
MTKVLRVGVLADTIDKSGGIPRYTREVVGALGRRDDVRLVVAAPAGAASTVAELAGPGLDQHLVIPRDDQLSVALWERYRSGRRFVAAGVDVVHGTKHLLPRGVGPTVLTVHDVMTITRAAESGRAKRMLLPAQFRASLRQATRLAAVSGATRTALTAIDPSWAPKTVVVPNGLSRGLLDAQAQPVTGLEGSRFALVVGDLTPRKNIGLLLRIWPEVFTRTDGLVLAVVGTEGPHADEDRARLVRLEEQGVACWVRGASDPVLRWCYERAQVVLFPSREEGFGLPVLEALAFDAPMIASTDAAVVEVAAGSPMVQHLDPDDAPGWRDAVVAAVTSPRPAATPPHFPDSAITWDEHVDRLVALYREVTAGR